MESIHRKHRIAGSRPRGIALILVLGMLAVTIAVSYAMMRSQVQTTLLQSNSQANNLAHQAAEAGLLRAIRKMSIDGEWGGVDTTMTGNVDGQSSYSLSFMAGDSSLSPTDPNYSQYPFRVTIVSTGTAISYGDAALPTTYTMSAVLQLVPRGLNTSAIPARWSELNSYTCYQWNSGNSPTTVDVDLPFQIQGNTCLMGTLNLAQNYPPYTAPRQQYLKDLKSMKNNTGVDYRPFTGAVALGSGRQNAATNNELTSWLGLTVTSPAPIAGNPWEYVNSPTTYQLYSGGPKYSVDNLASKYGKSLTAQVISPSVLTNPLGIFVAGDDINFLAGTKFTGILFADAGKDITFNGTGTVLNGVSMSLDGSSLAYQIPALMASDQLVVADGTSTNVNGLIMCWNKFAIKQGSQNTVFNVQGRLFADQFELSNRTEWANLNGLDWTTQMTLFTAQNLLPIGIKYFPQWMNNSAYQLKMQPRIVFQPPSNISYHWPDWSQPIYKKVPGDVGLRWNIVSWRDGP